MNPLISVIIPVYNVELYFEQCMESVLCQTYDNFEIILVDDGSTDESGRMCDRYAFADHRIRVFHRENQGQAAARNFGVIQARGDLVSFIDSDDYVTDDYLEYLYYLFNRFHSDIASASLMRGYEGEKVKIPILNKIIEKCLDTEQMMGIICEGTVSPCARLYKKKLLLDHPYPIGKIYEDLDTTYKIVDACNKLAYSTKVIYIYMQRTEGSTTHSCFSENSLYLFDALDRHLDFIQKKYPKLEDKAIIKCISGPISLLETTSVLQDGDMKNFAIIQNYVQRYAKRFFCISCESILKSILLKSSVIAIMLGYEPSRFFWWTKQMVKKLLRQLSNKYN